MFNIGAKVIVLKSNFKKKASPRRGSIGYISEIEVHTTKIGGIYTLFRYYGTATIIFTRYGFQKTTRSERRVVNIIIPILKGPDYINTLNKFSHKHITSNKNKEVIIAPINTRTSLIPKPDAGLSNNQFSWFRAVYNTPLFAMQLSNMLHTKTTNFDDTKTLTIIITLCELFKKEIDRSKKDLSDIATFQSILYERIIICTRIITTSLERSAHKGVIQSAYKICPFHNIIKHILFKSYYTVCLPVIKNNYKETYIKDINKTKELLIKLASTYKEK